MALYVLFEHAVGFLIFKVKEFEEIGSNLIPQVEESINDASKFKKIVNLHCFRAFKNAAKALENINALSEGVLTTDLSKFIESNLPKLEEQEITLGVGDKKLGEAISETFELKTLHVGVVPEILRGIRTHLTHLVKGLNAQSMKQSELGLGHAYSRGKVKFNIHRVDNMIIQSIALVDQLDKDINTFSMRIREWYSYHFPELSKVVPDNYQYAQCASFIKSRNELNPSMLSGLEEITKDASTAQAILDCARMSMGMDISPVDLLNIQVFAGKVASLAAYRKNLSEYLKNKMNAVAPNLATLIGDIVGARLISHAGSLTNLAKCPASTVQILGAEKALFRALKTKSNTPKYGLIYNSTFIGRAGPNNKGRISRYLANKSSLASRIDCFSDVLTTVYGEKLRDQVEDRLKFYQTGDLPKKNIDAMAEAASENEKAVKKLLKKKRKLEAAQEEDMINYSSQVDDVASKPKKKKKKKEKNDSSIAIDEVENMEVVTEIVKKKKKKKKISEQ